VVVGGEVLGLMVLGDRVGASRFPSRISICSVCWGSGGGRLAQRRLSQKLLQARELEAFQAMSAFFVHDLKTRLHPRPHAPEPPVHFNDPPSARCLREFSKTVSHINQLIARLSLLRHA